VPTVPLKKGEANVSSVLARADGGTATSWSSTHMPSALSTPATRIKFCKMSSLSERAVCMRASWSERLPKMVARVTCAKLKPE